MQGLLWPSSRLSPVSPCGYEQNGAAAGHAGGKTDVEGDASARPPPRPPDQSGDADFSQERIYRVLQVFRLPRQPLRCIRQRPGRISVFVRHFLETDNGA